MNLLTLKTVYFSCFAPKPIALDKSYQREILKHRKNQIQFLNGKLIWPCEICNNLKRNVNNCCKISMEKIKLIQRNSKIQRLKKRWNTSVVHDSTLPQGYRSNPPPAKCCHSNTIILVHSQVWQTCVRTKWARRNRDFFAIFSGHSHVITYYNAVSGTGRDTWPGYLKVWVVGCSYENVFWWRAGY